MDYLNVDVEGHELEVLKGVEWEEVEIDVISVETEKDSKVWKFLVGKGYREVEGWKGDGEDWVFVREGMRWGREAYPEAAKWFEEREMGR